jgi:hypothetical protein
MEFKAAIKDGRTAKEVIEDPKTDGDLRILLKLAVKRDGLNIIPTQDNSWEKSITTEKYMRMLWYGVPDKDHSSHVVGINKDTKRPLKEGAIRKMQKSLSN